ncbi:hypothetical protein niasHS_008268 [Heterodera schachtii]|uniref:DUF7083 domain-containing protein n=1 Tax=Heterodera schachtii TaxID=97005 RepID=A0ABD2IUG9_HETSC
MTTKEELKAILDAQQKEFTDLLSTILSKNVPSNNSDLFSKINGQIPDFEYDPEADSTFALWYERFGPFIEKDGQVLDDDIKCDIKSIFVRRFECFQLACAPTQNVLDFGAIVNARCERAEMTLSKEEVKCMIFISGLTDAHKDLRQECLRQLEKARATTPPQDIKLEKLFEECRAILSLKNSSAALADEWDEDQGEEEEQAQGVDEEEEQGDEDEGEEEEEEDNEEHVGQGEEEGEDEEGDEEQEEERVDEGDEDQGEEEEQAQGVGEEEEQGDEDEGEEEGDDEEQEGQGDEEEEEEGAEQEESDEEEEEEGEEEEESDEEEKEEGEEQEESNEEEEGQGDEKEEEQGEDEQEEKGDEEEGGEKDVEEAGDEEGKEKRDGDDQQDGEEVPKKTRCLCALSLILLVEYAIILWIIFGYVKKRLRPHKEIFICSDCWILVFDFLAPSQLGLEIALINRRFDRIVDEHFKTRKWKLGFMRICHKIGENGTKQMQIVNSDENPLPIPQNPLPNKVIGFEGLTITYIDQNAVAFLRRFRRIFAFSSIYLVITENVCVSEFVLLNVLPMLRDSIDVMYLNTIAFRRLRQLAPLLLNDCPSLHTVIFKDAILPEFPPDDSANASDGQAMTKWLFTPRPDGLPKVLTSHDFSVAQWSSTMEQLIEAFSNASSPITFRINFLSSSLIDFVVPFDLINEVTGEKLALQQYGTDGFLLSRCPIGWDQRKWQNVWKELSARQNPIDIRIEDGGYDDGLLDDTPAPSDDQQQK